MAESIRFDRLALRTFRNLAPLDLEPGPRFNVISGDNGQGKSNLLEAIAYLARLRSFRSSPSEELVQRGQESAALHARVVGDVVAHTLRVRIWKKGKARELALDEKRPSSNARWLAVCPLVLFHPGDLELAQGGPESRRALLDSLLGEIDPGYETTLAAYTKALRSRNRLLKAERPDRQSIIAYDPLLASHGAELVRARREILAELAPLAQRTFAEILGDEIPFEVVYAPRVDGGQDAIRASLSAAIDKDLARGFTADGPHADDVSLVVHGRGARHHASQGQQRTIVLALKVAELEVLTARVGRVPPLLLDDVSSELDRTRNRRFFELLTKIGAQVFLTTTHPELILLGEGDRRDLRIEAGRLVPS